VTIDPLARVPPQGSVQGHAVGSAQLCRLKVLLPLKVPLAQVRNWAPAAQVLPQAGLAVE
jgi:hypothetical protein